MTNQPRNLSTKPAADLVAGDVLATGEPIVKVSPGNGSAIRPPFVSVWLADRSLMFVRSAQVVVIER
jgi:hypothetical protein